jgi:hypothetical protein
MFGIDLHAQFRGKYCLSEYVKYILKFDERKNIVHSEHGNPDCGLCNNKTTLSSFTENIKSVNYDMNATPEQEEKCQEQKKIL